VKDFFLHVLLAHRNPFLSKFPCFPIDATKGLPITILMFSIPVGFQKHVTSIPMFFLSCVPKGGLKTSNADYVHAMQLLLMLFQLSDSSSNQGIT
jgi:hypothetical protein